MSSPAGFGFGIRFILDAHQNFSQEGLRVYLRIQNSDDSAQDFADVGFEIAVTGTLAQTAGTQDIAILPPPTAEQLTLHQIGILGLQLQFGATRFTISHTWVLQQMELMGYTNPIAVFRDKKRVVGIVYDGELHTIESINHEDFGGVIAYWIVICNAPQANVT